MASKKNNEGQTSASDPNPTATSPSASASPGDATTASLVPTFASSSASPTTTTTITHLIPSAPPQTTTHLPSLPSQLIMATTQPLPSVPPPPIRKTHQEPVSCTSDGATTTDLVGPSTAPSASPASRVDFMSIYATAVEGAMAAVQIAKEQDPAGMQVMAATSFGLRLDDVEAILECLLGLAGQMKGDAELQSVLEGLGNVEALESTVKVAEMALAERKKRDGSGGSEGSGGGPDSGSGEGDGEGGGVSV